MGKYRKLQQKRGWAWWLAVPIVKPVLLANLIAWPLAWWLMSQWLEGFAYRVSIPLTIFAGASLLALTVAMLTISSHALLVSRLNPASSLRYE